MLWREQVYERTLRATRRVLSAGWPRASVQAAVRGRQAALPQLRAWAGAQRTGAPLLLVHAPSVGEALMAQAIIAAVRAERPELQIAFTHFSPSAERVAARVGADVWSYLPWDTRADSEALLDALRPAAIAFVRTEIWPVLGAAAAARGIPALLLNAVLAPGSSRLRIGARTLLGPAYRRLHAVGAVAADDAARFSRLGVPADRVQVTGDARFDQVMQRVSALDPESPLLRRLRAPETTTLVAGSTWPADERLLAEALAQLPPAARPRVIIAPHRPNSEHLSGAEGIMLATGLSAQRLADMERDPELSASVILVDRVGVLADLYALADLAYVGGGFGSAGLHSVVEPAALAVPVLFGPRHGNAREAGELATAGGGFVVGRSTLPATLRELLSDTNARRAAGERAGAFVSSRLGGAAGNAALLVAAL